jgi:hypothetical protein
MRDRQQLRRRIISHSRRLIYECQQIINDTNAWNGLHPDEPPLDCAVDRVVKSRVERQLAQFIADHPE